MADFQHFSLSIPETEKPRIVVVGGGFGGLNFIKELDKQEVQIVLLDVHNYNMFQPLLYQVATAGLEPDSITKPFRNILHRKSDIYFRMVKVQEILPEEDLIRTIVGDLRYDYLVIATGTKTNFYGNKRIEDLAFPLKRVTDSLNLRSQIFQVFEYASLAKSYEDRDRLTNFVIVGGGPTGVEIAGALAELKRHILPHDFPDLDFDMMDIVLVESNARLLTGMSEKASSRALKDLKKMGVKVELNSLVKDFDGKCAELSDGRKIPTDTLIWAAGVTGNLIKGIPEEAIQRGRIIVNEFNQVHTRTNIFAIGDIAFLVNEEYPKGHPGVAQVAIQQGQQLARNLKRMWKKLDMKPFKYVDKGNLATIGRNKAVADLPGNIKFGGFLAWVIWMFVHVYYLIGFRNKLMTFVNWAWSYFTYDKGARLIIRPYVKKGDVLAEEFVLKNEMV